MIAFADSITKILKTKGDGLRTNVNFRVNDEQIDNYQRLADYVIPPGRRGQRGATRTIVFEYLCSNDPEKIKFLADGLTKYAEVLSKQK